MNETLRISYPIRLNRYLALCGVASRRDADLLIASGRIRVGDDAECSPGRMVAEGEEVAVDGKAVNPAPPLYIVMNKPRGVLSAVSDARRRTVMDLLPETHRAAGLFPAGRLDLDSEGLLILTNDGKFSQSVVHPSAGVRKTYAVILERVLEEKHVKEWARGVIIDKKLLAPAELSPGRPDDGRHWRVVLNEGFKREIRLMAEALGNRVVRLKRIGVGNLFLDKMPAGSWREFDYDNLRNMISNGGKI
ncbi:MAG: rRNA pseudouridine synthase [Synergistaceae bacterium]|jgi:23S rRNA pseudouridine2605 synthase|nr:rRNA pseudouridine synthase [Synergistaceae bacterium]